MVRVRIDEDDLIELLMSRLTSMWNPTSIEEELYQEYYENSVYGGAFEDSELNISEIVDNDYVNYLSVISEDELEDYNIEDEDDERILVTKEDYDGKKWFLIS